MLFDLEGQNVEVMCSRLCFERYKVKGDVNVKSRMENKRDEKKRGCFGTTLSRDSDPVIGTVVSGNPGFLSNLRSSRISNFRSHNLSSSSLGSGCSHKSVLLNSSRRDCCRYGRSNGSSSRSRSGSNSSCRTRHDSLLLEITGRLHRFW